MSRPEAPVRLEIEFLRASMEAGLWTSRDRVSIPMSARSEIVDVERAVAKTRRPVGMGGSVSREMGGLDWRFARTFRMKLSSESIADTARATPTMGVSVYMAMLIRYGYYPVIRTLLLPSAIVAPYHTKDGWGCESPSCIKAPSQKPLNLAS